MAANLKLPNQGRIFPALVFLLSGILACTELADPEGVQRYRFENPPHFPEPTYTFGNNSVSEKGFKLGKALFFDPRLSRDESVACANCHIQAHAFADSWLHPFSIGVDDRKGTRNAPPLFNLAFQKEFFWDGGVTHLDFTPITAIESPVEMDEHFGNVVQKLRVHRDYPERFEDAFGIRKITGPYVLHALSQFMVMMVSADSRYDRWVLGDPSALDAEEVEGLTLFRKHCGSCHTEPLFSDLSYRNNGIQADIIDFGREIITEQQEDRGKFKVPSLRNIAVTSPYMHNAAFRTLEEVLDHYSSGVNYHTTLDPALVTKGRPGIPLDLAEKQKIITFLEALTDSSFLKNPLFFQSDEM